MKIAAVALIAFLLVLVAAAAFAPASLADRSLASESEGRLRIENATGTIWNGSGTLTNAGNTWRMPFGWRIPPGSLLASTRELVLTPPDGAATPLGTIGIGSGSATLRNVSIELPAQALVDGATQRLPLALGGVVAVTASAFEWNGERGSGALNARWRDARMVVVGAVADLGVVDVTLAPEGNRLSGRIGNTGGDVRVDGTVSVTGATVTVDGTVAPTAGAPPFIAQALAALGTPDGSGAVRIAWRGSLK
jgi:hypothetical protein